MKNKLASEILDNEYPLLFKKLFTVLDDALKSKYSQEHDETKRVFLSSSQGIVFKKMVTYSMIDDSETIAGARGNRPTRHLSTIQYPTEELAANAIKIIQAISEFLQEEFSVTVFPERGAVDMCKIYCNF